MRDTSDLADAIIDASLDRLHEWQCADLGTPDRLRGRASAARCPGARQAGRERAELLLRHRPHIHLSGERSDRGRTAQRRQRSLLSPDRAQADEGARRADRGRHSCIASTCGCGRSGPRGRSCSASMRWRSTTSPMAATGSATRSSGQGRSAATWRWRPSCSSGFGRSCTGATSTSARCSRCAALKVVMEQEVARKGMEHSVKHGPGGHPGGGVHRAGVPDGAGRSQPRVALPASADGSRSGSAISGCSPSMPSRRSSAAYRFLRAAEHRLQDGRRPTGAHAAAGRAGSSSRIAASNGVCELGRVLRAARASPPQRGRAVRPGVRGRARDRMPTAGGDPLGSPCSPPRPTRRRVWPCSPTRGSTMPGDAWSDRCALPGHHRAQDARRRQPREAGPPHAGPDACHCAPARRDDDTWSGRCRWSSPWRDAASTSRCSRSGPSRSRSSCSSARRVPGLPSFCAGIRSLFDELLDPRTLYEPLAPDELEQDIARASRGTR